MENDPGLLLANSASINCCAGRKKRWVGINITPLSLQHHDVTYHLGNVKPVSNVLSSVSLIEGAVAEEFVEAFTGSHSDHLLSSNVTQPFFKMRLSLLEYQATDSSQGLRRYRKKPLQSLRLRVYNLKFSEHPISPSPQEWALLVS
jgi:hypothetical protein